MGFPSPLRPDRRCQESDRSTNTGGTLGVGRWTVRQQDMGGEHLDPSAGGGGGGEGFGEETEAVVATREKRAMETQTQT